MKTIIPCIGFDTEAGSAAAFYTSIFKNGKINCVSHYPDDSQLPKGTVLVVDFELCGQKFVALNGGPMFKITPALSFYVDCETEEEVDDLWSKLTEGGFVMMALGSYPFSEKFGWVQDKFGVSWQINLSKTPQKVKPFFMFVGDQAGKAEAAIDHYSNIFEDSSTDFCLYYGEGDTDPSGSVKLAGFTLNNQQFMAIDSHLDHAFTFTEGLSLQINCDNQAEIDRLWDRLSADGEKSVCGWVKDKFGVSWVIASDNMDRLLTTGTTEQSIRVMNAMKKMTKIDKAALERAFDGE